MKKLIIIAIIFLIAFVLTKTLWKSEAPTKEIKSWASVMTAVYTANESK